MRPTLRSVEVPDFGLPDHQPDLPAGLYAERLEAVRRRMRDDSYQRLVIYGDREHSANLAYLTGFDPRFEEALLVVGPDGEPTLLAGNECVGLAEAAPLPMKVVRFQDFSLPGQPRGDGLDLDQALRDAGVETGLSVGVVGWKPFADRRRIDVPAFIADALRSLAGEDRVRNATHLFMDAVDGLRVVNEAAQLAAFEYAACHTSSGVRRLVENLRPGLGEHEAVRHLQWNGSPLSCHLMLSSGPRAALGLVSPTDRVMERGDPVTVAFGIWGALNCRAGFLVADADELPAGISDYVDRLVAPYFAAVAAWYRTLRVGVTGGELFAAVAEHVGDPFFGVFLNPGHQIHLDEWVNSPVFTDSPIELRSGMALQCDIIPATGGPYFTTNIEDGLALADDDLRAELADRSPAAWARIQARRTFMREHLGLDLHASVLPFSSFPACLPPYLLSPDRVMTVAS